MAKNKRKQKLDLKKARKADKNRQPMVCFIFLYLMNFKIFFIIPFVLSIHLQFFYQELKKKSTRDRMFNQVVQLTVSLFFFFSFFSVCKDVDLFLQISYGMVWEKFLTMNGLAMMKLCQCYTYILPNFVTELPLFTSLIVFNKTQSNSCLIILLTGEF